MDIKSVATIAPFLSDWLNEVVTVLVIDNEKVVAASNHPKLDLKIVEGRPINEYEGSITVRAFRNKQKLIANVSKEKSIFGISYAAISTPIYDGDNLIGAIGIGLSTDKYNTLINMGQEILAAVQEITASAETLSSMSNDLSSTTNDMNCKMELMSMDMGNIEKVTLEMRNIANKTKVLGINASIESVKAGSHGLGFSVVAEEVRKLADTSKVSASGIEESLLEIKTVLSQILSDIKNISNDSDAQATGIVELLQALNTVRIKADELVKMGTIN